MITPMDIHNKTFSKQIRGYSSEEVNSFLEELAGDYERIYREHREMEEEMDAIKTKLRNYEMRIRKQNSPSAKHRMKPERSFPTLKQHAVK